MALLMLALGLLSGASAWLLVTLVGLVATLLESLIGATAQQRGETLLGWLQAAAGHVPASTSQSAIASRAAMAV